MMPDPSNGNAITRRQRRHAVEQLLDARDQTPLSEVAERFGVPVRVIVKDIQQILQRQNRREVKQNTPGRLIRTISRIGVAAFAEGDFATALRAECTIGKITGAIPTDSVNVQATAQASAQITTFAELSKKAAQDYEAGNRVAGLTQ